jgi:hypothetical protein
VNDADAHPLVELTPEEIEALPEGDSPEEDFFIAEGDPFAEGEYPVPETLAPPYKCPNPTKWKLARSAVKTTGQWVPVSSGVLAPHGDIQYTFHVERTVTWGAVVSGSIKGSLAIVEMQAGLSLDTHTTLTTSETFAWTIKKGTRMALFAAPGYIVREFERTTYGSAMCNVVKQVGTVHSPYMHFLKADRF